MSITTISSSSRLITDKINAEWGAISVRPTPPQWGVSKLADGVTLKDAVDALARCRRHDPVAADEVLIDLLTRHSQGDEMAGRFVLQVMLGRAINLARKTYRPGALGTRGDLAQLTAAAVAALWGTIATYPVHRRRRKVAVNLCMETLRCFISLIDDDARDVVDDQIADTAAPLFAQHEPPSALAVLQTLTWAVETRALSLDEAAILVRVYCPPPGREGGAQAVSRELGITSASVRQRCSRAISRLAAAIQVHDNAVVEAMAA